MVLEGDPPYVHEDYYGWSEKDLITLIKKEEARADRYRKALEEIAKEDESKGHLLGALNCPAVARRALEEK